MITPTQALHLMALGPPEVRLGEKQLTFPTRKTLALLLYLALEPGSQPREHLGTLFWPEASPARSLASLRNTLGHLQTVLRQASGNPHPPYLSITHQTLGLNLEAEMTLDLHTVARAYALARADRSSRTLPIGTISLPTLISAASLARGEFLAGFSLGDAPAFDDWAASQREIWHRRLGLILDRLSEIQYSRGEFANTTETTSQWLGLDGLNEVAYRRKMRAHFAEGARGQALETYETCRTLLATDLGIEPEPETTALAERIRTQPSPPQPRQQSQTRPPETPVAYVEHLFTGRVQEHLTLVNCFALAAAGQPQFVVLRGEAGIGKTRLAREFLMWARDQSAGILEGGTFESGSHLPFQPLVEALRQWLEEKAFPKEILEEVWAAPLIQLLPELRARVPGMPPLQTGYAPLEDVAQPQFFEAITQLTLALSQQAPLILFIDDLQWTDSGTLDLLQYALRRWKARDARVLLLVCLRSEALHPMTQPTQSDGTSGLIQWLSRARREVSPVHLELETLGEQETVQMVQRLLAFPAPDFAQWVYDETRGHPFYLMETLKDLLERRVLHPKRRAEGPWVFTVDSEHDLGQTVRVPSTVHAVIRTRLHRLSPQAFSLLAVGAVLEQGITFERLCNIANLTEDLALPALDELISGRLLLQMSQLGLAGGYTFANDMLRDVVYTEAGDARRRLFHRRALEILETAGASAAMLAHHAVAAGLAPAAFRHSLTAGREAIHLSALREAFVHLERARKLAQEDLREDMPDEAEIHELNKLFVQAVTAQA